MISFVKNIFLFTSLILLLVSCEKKDTCPTPVLEISGGGSNSISFSMGDGIAHDFFEIEYGLNGFSKGAGTTVQVNNYQSISGLTPGTYDFYGRGNCGGTEWSGWSEPKSVVIN